SGNRNPGFPLLDSFCFFNHDDSLSLPLDFLWHASLSPRGFAGLLECLYDLIIASTSAQVAGNTLLNLVLCRIRMLFEQFRACHQEAGRTVATLDSASLHKGVLNRV